MSQPGDNDYTTIVSDAWQAGVHLLKGIFPVSPG
jgi:hypothetical protein